MSANRVCNSCLREVPFSEELYDRRIELRNQRSMARYRTWKTAQVCRGCADAERPVTDVRAGQESLL